MKKVIIEGYEDSQIVIFDGVCNLCHAGVNFIIKHDKAGKIKHTPAQSEIAQRLQQALAIDVLSQDTSIFYDRGNVYYKGKGGLYICKYLDPWWLKAISVFRFLPHFMLDPLYNYVANNRYKWYGKKEHCMMPTPDVEARFL